MIHLRVDWSIGRLGYRQRVYTDGSDAQTALRRPSCGQKRDETVFRAASAGGPMCEQTCSQPPLGAILSSQPLTMSIYDAYAPLERMGTATGACGRPPECLYMHLSSVSPFLVDLAAVRRVPPGPHGEGGEGHR